MTKERAIEILSRVASYEDLANYLQDYSVSVQDALLMAIEALSAEPCEDAINRQAVLDLIYNSWKHNGVGENYGELSIDALKALPPVTPKQKMGRWIPVSERLPEDRDWNLAVFREKDTGYQCIPRVASYVGHDMWIVIDADSVDRGWFSDLECIAWMPLPEPYKGGE